MTRHIPVTILGGYLGSGKTTAINHLLAGDHGIRIAVLVNDFGAVNVDASLIADTSDQTISLTNGCVCCSIADDLGEALDAQTARTAPPEHIVIEASGVAEPARIAAYASGWPGVALNNVVTVADAETVQERSADKYVGGVVKRQIEAAGLILLSKGDLAGAERVRSLKPWLQQLNGRAQIESADHGKVEADLLLERRDAVLADASGHRPLRSASGFPPAEEAMPSLLSRHWRPAGPVDASAIAEVLRQKAESIHRVKGSVRNKSDGSTLLFQMAGSSLEIYPQGVDALDQGLVLIGTDAPDLEALQEALESVARPEANRRSEPDPGRR